MKYKVSLIFLLILSVSCQAAQPEKTQVSKFQETINEAKNIESIQSAGLSVFPKDHRVCLEGEICTAGDLVEFFAVTEYGHKYESIIAVKCRPSQFHSALLLSGGIDRAAAREQKQKIEGSHFSCQVSWDLPDRFAQVEPYKNLQNLKPDKLYAMTYEKQGTENEWWEVSPWKIAWQPDQKEGKIFLAQDMPELLDPQDPEYYWRNRVRRTTITNEDQVIYYFDQPNPKVKGQFKPFGTLKKIREEPRHYSVPAGDLVVSLESGQPLGELTWIFAGSLIDTALNRMTQEKETFYVADRTGVVMQLMPDDFSVLDNSVKLPKLQNRIGTAFGVNEKVCPPVGTPVVLEFELIQ